MQSIYNIQLQWTRRYCKCFFNSKKTAFKNNINVDIVPLFESVQDLENAESILGELFSEESYRFHLKQRRNTQTVMLGFSDGTKDGGYITANWKILQARKKSCHLVKKHGLDIVFLMEGVDHQQEEEEKLMIIILP